MFLAGSAFIFNVLGDYSMTALQQLFYLTFCYHTSCIVCNVVARIPRSRFQRAGCHNVSYQTYLGLGWRRGFWVSGYNRIVLNIIGTLRLAFTTDHYSKRQTFSRQLFACGRYGILYIEIEHELTTCTSYGWKKWQNLLSNSI